MSSGITRPFGRLSQSPGHVSDTLLTRSPLIPIARDPYDLHVLATPPAFRLSQDQTLQLDFVARARPHARWGRHFCPPFPGLTVSGPAFILETSLSTPKFKTNFGAVTASAPAKARRSAKSNDGRQECLPHQTWSKAQTSSMASQKLIKEDHFLRAPQGCLRSRCAGLVKGRRLGSPGPFCTPERPDTHPRGIRLFTCQRTRRFPVQASPTAFAAVAVLFPFEFPVRGGGILSSIPPLSNPTCASPHPFHRCDRLHRHKPRPNRAYRFGDRQILHLPGIKGPKEIRTDP